MPPLFVEGDRLQINLDTRHGRGVLIIDGVIYTVTRYGPADPNGVQRFEVTEIWIPQPGMI